MANFLITRARNTLRKISYLKASYQLFRRILHKFGIIKDKPFPVRPYQFSSQDAQRIYEIVLSGDLHHTSGNEAMKLEREFASYHKTRFSLATNSGTSALELALKAVAVGHGDEVIVPGYTFVATAQAVLSQGAIPVFADIDDTFTISPDSIEKNISKRTKAIIPVHLFGNVADMDSILSIAKKNNLYVIEDACQAVGAKYKGRNVGSLGDIGCFSFNEKKAIFTGQGGMFVTSNPKFYQSALITRETGLPLASLEGDVVSTGHNFAITEMQAALARSILRQLDTLNNKRRVNYQTFTECMETDGLPIRWYRILPVVEPSFSRLVFMIDFQKLGVSRNHFLKRMELRGIPMKAFYPTPLYKYSIFRNKWDTLTKSSFPFSLNKNIDYRGVNLPYVELFCREQAGIQFSPYLTRNQIQYFCETLASQMREYLGRKK